MRLPLSSILFLSDQNQKLIGQYELASRYEKVIQFDIRVPDGWRVTSLKGSDGKPVPYQRNVESDETRLNIRIPGGIPAGTWSAFWICSHHTPGGGRLARRQLSKGVPG